MDAHIKENRYPKNRHGSLLQIEDKKMLSKLNKLLYEKMYPEEKHAPSKTMLRYAIALACIALLIIVLCATSISRKQNASSENTTESTSILGVTESNS